jgi:hypothetical protein
MTRARFSTPCSRRARTTWRGIFFLGRLQLPAGSPMRRWPSLARF